MYYYSFRMNFVWSFLSMWVGEDALATLAHLSPPPTLPNATQEAHANYAVIASNNTPSCVGRDVRRCGSVLRAPPALRTERLSALLRVQATSLRSETLHPTQSRHIACAASPLSVEKLPPPLESPTSKHYHCR